MSLKNYFLILISLNLKLLIKAEVPRYTSLSNNEKTANQRIEALERELTNLRADNRFMRLRLERMQREYAKLREEFENFNATVSQKQLENVNFNDNLQQLLTNFLSHAIEVTPKATKVERVEKESTNDETIKNYDEHFNCISNCENSTQLPKSCAEALAINRTGDGLYQLYAMNLKPFYTNCLQDAYGDNAWMIIQRREWGNINFARNWSDYLYGFGDLNGDYWLGLERLHALTATSKHELWIQMKDHTGIGRFANYKEFAIGNASDNFRLIKLGEYDGDAGNSLIFNLNATFSTIDRDNDEEVESNCAEKRMGGWWFNDCKYSNLNGIYNSTDYGTGINWIGWHDYRYSLKYIHIAIRPIPVDSLQKTAMIIKPDLDRGWS